MSDSAPKEQEHTDDEIVEQEPAAASDDAERIEIVVDEDDVPEGAEANAADTPDDLQTQLDEVNNRLLRVSADYQNYIKRSQQNTQTALEQQIMSVAKDLVTVLDHFDRALQVDEEKISAKDLLTGINMVHEELLRTLGKFGIQRIEANAGDAFDPNQHEAMMHQAAEDIESNHIIMQLQPGYALNDKTVRPAGVSVAE